MCYDKLGEIALKGATWKRLRSFCCPSASCEPEAAFVFGDADAALDCTEWSVVSRPKWVGDLAHGSFRGKVVFGLSLAALQLWFPATLLALLLWCAGFSLSIFYVGAMTWLPSAAQAIGIFLPLFSIVT